MGELAETTSLLRMRTGNGTEGSNPSLSATVFLYQHRWQGFNLAEYTKQHMTYRTEVRFPVNITGGNALALQNTQNNIYHTALKYGLRLASSEAIIASKIFCTKLFREIYFRSSHLALVSTANGTDYFCSSFHLLVKPLQHICPMDFPVMLFWKKLHIELRWKGNLCEK